MVIDADDDGEVDAIVLTPAEGAEIAAWLLAVGDWRDAAIACPGVVSEKLGVADALDRLGT